MGGSALAPVAAGGDDNTPRHDTDELALTSVRESKRPVRGQVDVEDHQGLKKAGEWVRWAVGRGVGVEGSSVARASLSGCEVSPSSDNRP